MTTADFTLAVAVQNIVWGLSQAPIGAIADRFGLPATMVAGAATYVVGPSVMADSAGTTGLLVSGGLIGVALSCTASSRGLTAVARAVSETRRSKMLGVAAVGSIHTLLVPPATQELLTHQAWQIGVLCFLIPAVVMLPAGFWPAAPTGCREVPGPRRRCAVLREAARHRPFLVMSGPIHAPALAICGQDPMLSAEALAVIGGMNSIGSPLAGRYPKHTLLGLLYILRAFAFIVYFMMPPTPASTLVFAAAMGGLWLSGAPHFSGMVAEVFGTRYMATLLGIALVMHQVGSSGGGGLIFDAFGSYDGAWRTGVLISFAAGCSRAGRVAGATHGGWPTAGDRPVRMLAPGASHRPDSTINAREARPWGAVRAGNLLPAQNRASTLRRMCAPRTLC